MSHFLVETFKYQYFITHENFRVPTILTLTLCKFLSDQTTLIIYISYNGQNLLFLLLSGNSPLTPTNGFY